MTLFKPAGPGRLLVCACRATRRFSSGAAGRSINQPRWLVSTHRNEGAAGWLRRAGFFVCLCIVIRVLYPLYNRFAHKNRLSSRTAPFHDYSVNPASPI